MTESFFEKSIKAEQEQAEPETLYSKQEEFLWRYRK